MRRGWFLLLFALSGAAALVYEVVWTRLLTLQIGHGLAAASTVLAAFMGGLAAGAVAGGRIGQRLDPRRALRVYALLEGGIAMAALALPLVLAGLHPVLSALYANGEGGLAFGTVRLLSSLVLLSIPAAAMGATFPLASRWVVQSAEGVPVEAGRLYAVNTLGAAAGAIATGFILLPSLGLTGATMVGVALNLIAAGGAWWLAGATAAATAPPTAAGSLSTRTRGPVSPGRPWLAAAALGVTGFASLALQVVWTRLLASMLGPTTYAFSAVVALFILGIAGGSAIGAWLARRLRRPIAALALTIAACATLALVAAATVDPLLLAVAEIVARPDAGFGQVLVRQWAFAAAVLMPMAITFGLAFPLALAVATRDESSMVADLGVVYAVNTAGAIAGALGAGFVLVPWLGLFETIRLVGALLAICATGLALVARPGPAWAAVGLGIVAGSAAFMVPEWDPRLLSSGAYKYSRALRGPDLRTALTAGELQYYREGSTATVAVRRLTGTTSLSIDGKVDASDAADMLTQRLLAHVPLLLHPDPKQAAILGLGSGVTLGSALTHGLDRAVVLEISPEVVEASRFFDHVNHRPLADPRTTLVVGDGRTHLQLTDERYDVIVSEPSNPWMAGIATLFTQEFFEAARARLAPGGVLCQWAHTYDISDADLRSIVATFLSVFPDGTLWLVGEADVLLVGSTGPLTDRLAAIGTPWQRPGVADDLASVGARSPLAVLSAFIAEGPALGQWAGDAPVQTDDRARLEFSGPRSVFGRDQTDNARSLLELAAATPRPAAVTESIAQASSADWRDLADMLYRADGYAPAMDLFVRALQHAPRDRQALDGLVRAAVPLGRTAEARSVLAKLASDPVNDDAKLALSQLLAAEGAFDESARIPLGMVQSQPANLAAVEQLASIFSDAGDAERLAPAVARLRAQAMDRATTRYYSATLAYMQQRPDIAVGEAEAALAIDPSFARAQNVLGAALAGLGQRDRARAAFHAALRLDPRDPANYSNLATLEMEGGNRDLAHRLFAEALTLDPGNAVARDGLARTLAP